MQPDTLQDFLSELTRLTEIYGIQVGGPLVPQHIAGHYAYVKCEDGHHEVAWCVDATT